jgi:hypothetical protein
MQLNPGLPRRLSCMWKPLLSSVVIFASTASSGSLEGGITSAECRLYARAPQRLLLPDESRVLIDPSSIAVQGDEVLIVGSTLHVFNEAGDMVDHGAIGVLRDPSGDVSLVSSPLPPANVSELQAVAARGGGWHVTFVTGTRGASWHPSAYNTADVWYAHHDGMGWTRTERVTRVRAANFSRAATSNIVETARGVAFAIVFDRSWDLGSNEAGNQGVIMLLNRHDGWSEDTLRTWEAPRSVRLAVPDGKVRAIIAQSYFANRRPHGAALFMADYDTTWQQPVMVYNPAPQYVYDIIMPKGGEAGQAVSWRRAVRGLDVDTGRLEWGVLSEDHSIQPVGVASVASLDVPATVATADGVTVWVVRDGVSRDLLRFYAATDTRVRDLGVLNVPLMNVVISAVPLEDGRIVVVTAGPDTATAAQPPFATYITEVTVRCGIGRT